MANGSVGATGKLGIGDGSSPEVFTDISEVTSISGPSFTAEAVDMTHLNSSNNYREYDYGMIDGGEVTFEGRWIPTDSTHNDSPSGVLGIMESRTVQNFQLTFPDGSDFVFAAVVTGLQPNIGGENDPVNMSVTLKVTGQPTLTQSA